MSAVVGHDASVTFCLRRSSIALSGLLVVFCASFTGARHRLPCVPTDTAGHSAARVLHNARAHTWAPAWALHSARVDSSAVVSSDQCACALGTSRLLLRAHAHLGAVMGARLCSARVLGRR